MPNIFFRLFLINSPVVRGDNLRFREAGVKEVISRVLLPFLNAFRFFAGQCTLLKKEQNIDFKYDPHAPKSTNVMDRWILAKCQSLIQLLHDEMTAYRLYAVVPKLLDLVDELTNWYIKFNRRRLKGESGVEDTLAALNSLFETLLTLCRTLVSLLCLLPGCCTRSLNFYDCRLRSRLSLPRTFTNPYGLTFLPISLASRWAKMSAQSISCPSPARDKSTSTRSWSVKCTAWRPLSPLAEPSEISTPCRLRYASPLMQGG